MAIILFGPTVVGASGTIGGITFSRNRSGPYIQSWRRPTDPKTLPQQSARGMPGAVARWWASLTPAQTDDWETLANEDPEPRTNPFGEPIALPGFGYFASLNGRRRAVDQPPIFDPPEGDDRTRPPNPTIISLLFYGATQPDPDPRFFSLFWDATEDPHPGDTVRILAGFNRNASTTRPESAFIALPPIDFSDGEAHPSWEQIFGRPPGPPGWRGFVQLFRQRPSMLRSIATVASGVTIEP